MIIIKVMKDIQLFICFDGHNLFLNSDATYGKSWGLADFLDHYDKKLIIVGIECNHEGNERLSEYCPYNLNSRLFWTCSRKRYSNIRLACL